MKISPILLFVYNRPDHAFKALQALSVNEMAASSDLYVFSDGPRDDSQKDKVSAVRKVVAGFAPSFKSFHMQESETNQGLAASIISGVTSIIERHGRVVVVEDDLITSSDFLTFMNSCLDFYEKEKRIFSVTGYSPRLVVPFSFAKDVTAFYRISSWGWGTWEDRWRSVDWQVRDFESFIANKHERKSFNRSGEDATIMLLKQMEGEIDSWAIRFNYAAYKQDALTIFPARSKVNNIGADGSGTHFGKTKKYQVSLSESGPPQLVRNIEPDKLILRRFRKHHRPSLLRRAINWWKLRRYLKRASR